MDDQRLVRYLLGELPAEEAERLDELSIADDEVAWRLRAAEHDLVDAYVRGELSGATRERFRSVYLSTPQGRQRVAFAAALIDYQRGAGDEAAAPGREAGPRPDVRSAGGLAAGGVLPPWALAAAAMVALATTSYLFLETRRLRQQVNEIQAARANAEQTAQSLRTVLEQERSTAASIRDELTRLHESLPSIPVPSLRPFLLLPMRRGAGEVATIALPEGIDQVPFRLRLEPDDFRSYDIVLRDPATGRVGWRSGRVLARPEGADRYVELQVPSSVLKPQNYVLELSGHRRTGVAEFVTSYAFRVRRE